MKQTAVDWLVQKFNQCEPMYSGIQSLEHKHYLDNLIEQAKVMEKEQMKDAFVECWKSNVPDGVECKLDAEQYYNKTFKSE